MEILIIGSKGFIGQQLEKFYTEKGINTYGADVVIDYENVSHYYLIDSSDADFAKVFQDRQFDVCINCSGAASVPDSITNPKRDYYLNTLNVFKLLDAIRNYQSDCKFINLSSAAVYGNPERLPVLETFQPNPLSPYGMHKYQSEIIAREFYDHWGIRTCSLRIFSAYGEGLKKQLFWDLNKRAISGDPITLYGTGRESRDFIHISDLVRAIDLVAQNAAFDAEIINIANGEEVFIQDAVNAFYSNYPRKIDFHFSGEIRRGDPLNWKADTSKLRGYGYSPEITMETGLKRYYNWLQGDS